MEKNEFIRVNSNIQKKIINEGSLGKKPSLGWTCSIILTRKKENITDNLTITIGNGYSANERAVERCVESMNLGEESLFRVKTEKEKLENEIIIALKSFVETRPYIFQWSDDEKLKASNLYKTKGASLFKESYVEEAFYQFSNGLKLMLTLNSVLENDDPGEDVNNLRIALYNNIAGCHLHFKNYDSVIKLCSDSLVVNPNVKAFYRRALAFIELKEYEKAERDILEILKLEPKNKAALEKYKLIKELDRANRENYESIVKKMFR